MTERLELGISKIWAESWTSLEALAGRHDLFGELMVRVGAKECGTILKARRVATKQD